ncbi:phosphoribosylglycinamide formyltransferase [Candidatus Magnetaquicoccus inordinatus]|uniref:phosphoribosylglycinamide formyltransferase n=1 Tax=Candidatus Magnetaquicoccus inordinatus TaxID=2496818 RepID=UPI00102BF099|nr:phosphoribosylglycinamide formyltransferase [Candidatus Magnetaquicoccus inordinatus]
MPTPSSPLRIAVLVSGSGSNLQALIDGCASGLIPGQIVLVLSNNPEAFGIERAKRHQIPTEVVNHRLYANRAAFDQELTRLLEQYEAQLVCLAGFMRVLTAEFTQHFAGRLLNIHPALLPAFPGLHVQQQAIDAGVRFSGATVHFVVPEVDAGPIVVQAVVPVLADDTADSLAARILRQEHRIYPLAVRWFAQGRLSLTGKRVQLRDAQEEREAALIHPSGE